MTLTVAGGDHPRFPGYSAAARAQWGERAGVRWLGPLDEAGVRAAFASAQVVVLPGTASTGASSVLHRAAGYGRPVVASDLPDLRAVAAEEDLRVNFTPPGDAGQLAAALRGLLADPVRQREQAEHNLCAVQRMSLAHTCRQYLEVFGRVSHSP